MGRFPGVGTARQRRANFRYAWIRSFPLPRPAAGFRLCQTPFAVSQTAQVSVFEFALIRAIRVSPLQLRLFRHPGLSQMKTVFQAEVAG